MKFSDLYFTNNDWGSSTVLEVNPGSVNENEELPASKALAKYSDYEVIAFSLNWVSLRASERRPHNKEERIVTLKEFKRNLDTQIMQVQLDANSMYGLGSRSVNIYGKLVKLETLLEVREALKEVEG